jgi:hypothetical protein
MNLFARRRAPGRAAAVKGWVAAHLGLGEADLVTVAELACNEPGCPPVETVVTVHGSDGARRNWRIHKPLADVAETDVIAVIRDRSGR